MKSFEVPGIGMLAHDDIVTFKGPNAYFLDKTLTGKIFFSPSKGKDGAFFILTNNKNLNGGTPDELAHLGAREKIGYKYSWWYYDIGGNIISPSIRELKKQQSFDNYEII
jgi:hypothetical protein